MVHDYGNEASEDSQNDAEPISNSVTTSWSSYSFYDCCVMLVSQCQSIQFMVDPWTSRITCLSVGAINFLGMNSADPESLTISQILEGMTLSEWAKIVAPLAARQRKCVSFGAVIKSPSRTIQRSPPFTTPTSPILSGNTNSRIWSSLSTSGEDTQTVAQRKRMAVTITMQFYGSDESRELIATVLDNGSHSSGESNARIDLVTSAFRNNRNSQNLEVDEDSQAHNRDEQVSEKKSRGGFFRRRSPSDSNIPKPRELKADEKGNREGLCVVYGFFPWEFNIFVYQILP